MTCLPQLKNLIISHPSNRGPPSKFSVLVHDDSAIIICTSKLDSGRYDDFEESSFISIDNLKHCSALK